MNKIELRSCGEARFAWWIQMVQTKMIALSVLPQTQKANKTLKEGLPHLLLQYPVNTLAQQSELLRSTAEPVRMGQSIAAGSSLKVQRSGIEDCAAQKQTLQTGTR